jgi:hypothetical protein
MTAREIARLRQLHEQGYVIRIDGKQTVAFREKGHDTAYVDGNHAGVGDLEEIEAGRIRVLRDVTAEVFAADVALAA